MRTYHAICPDCRVRYYARDGHACQPDPRDARIAELEAEVERLKRERTGWRQSVESNQRLRAALEKIAEAERLGYGTQRTYGQIATEALKGSDEPTSDT
jgi:hypothetical protein